MNYRAVGSTTWDLVGASKQRVAGNGPKGTSRARDPGSGTRWSSWDLTEPLFLADHELLNRIAGLHGGFGLAAGGAASGLGRGGAV